MRSICAPSSGLEMTRPSWERKWSASRSEEHTSELQSHSDLVCRLLLEKKKNKCAVRLGLTEVSFFFFVDRFLKIISIIACRYIRHIVGVFWVFQHQTVVGFIRENQCEL